MRIITEWIPITERKPGYYEECFVTIRLTDPDGHVETVVDAALHYGDKEPHYIGQFDTWNDWLDGCCMAEIIAWMPFPPDYREEVK